MIRYPVTPLDRWIQQKTGGSSARPLTRRDISRYQLRGLYDIIAYVRRRSSFYKQHFRGVSENPLRSLKDLQSCPFTTADDIRRDPFRFLCVSRDEVARVVTLNTSGSTGFSKRFFFTEQDLELTIDFFHHGMSVMARPGRTVMIFMPGESPGSVGDLLARGLARMNVNAIRHGPVYDVEVAIREIAGCGAHCLVALPVQALSLVRRPEFGRIPPGQIKSVLLSADYVPGPIIREIENKLHCRVFQHYGMTEIGYGGAVECAALSGGHYREADLYMEIVDPESGNPLQKGEWGEIAVTTLTRRAMPLIRYLTGDIGRFIPEPCPCGTVLERLDKVRGRKNGQITLSGGGAISLPALDETVFQIPEVLDYRVELIRKGGAGYIKLHVRQAGQNRGEALDSVKHAVLSIASIKAAAGGGWKVDCVLDNEAPEPSGGARKRMIEIID